MGDDSGASGVNESADDDINNLIEELDSSDLIHDSLSDLENHAVELAKLAINFDNQNQWEPARYYYQECVAVLLQLMENNSGLTNLTSKIQDYLNRAEFLAEKLSSKDEKSPVDERTKGTTNSSTIDLKRAEFLIREAINEDEEGHEDDAIELYLQAVEVCLKAKSTTSDQEMKCQLTTLADRALSRAEELKECQDKLRKLDIDMSQLVVDPSVTNKPSGQSQSIQSSSQQPQRTSSSQSKGLAIVQNQSPGQQQQFITKKGLIVLGSSSYSKEELTVLKLTSVINQREYVPFLSIDLAERFAYPIPFSDRNGLLNLSPKQKSRLKKWVRLDELHPNPKIFGHEIDCFSIKQTLVSDCSFMSSLMVSALYEKKFKEKLISNIIYPQNKSGEAVYNPCGKYMIKLHINGVRRKVIIDDLFPVDDHGTLLCSYSSKSDEFWVSLLEKSYMKVMGGYDFPGSNSSIDLHALTGWIPERMSTKDDTFNGDKVFSMLLDRNKKGDVLITAATGELSDVACDRTGLVSTHAYAVLDLRLVEGKKLLLLKNPWSHIRWKGNYSERDTTNWTPSLRRALNYDPNNAKSFDDGVFYIDLKSFCTFFDAIYLNWKPSLFKYTFCTHDVWKSNSGPVKDLYNIGHNPQYKLVAEKNSSIWIVLTRHITDKDDFAQNRIYIALIVYRGGKKVYLPFEPPPEIDGARINSPHYLCKIAVPGSETSTSYTLVISQFEKSTTIFYSLRVYSTEPFQLTKIKSNFEFKQKVTGEWTNETAGGCGNNPSTYHLNPVYQLEVQGPNDADNKILIDLKGPKQYSVGFDVKTVTIKNPSSPYYFKRTSSGTFRSGFTILELNPVPPGTYNIIPCTFQPNQKGPFFLEVQANCPIKLERIR